MSGGTKKRVFNYNICTQVLGYICKSKITGRGEEKRKERRKKGGRVTYGGVKQASGAWRR